MNILAQLVSNFQKDLAESECLEMARKLISTVYQNLGVNNYVEMIESTGKTIYKEALSIIKTLLERMDLEFRNARGRTDRYYVKQTRERTIVTPFGELTYKRTEYIDRDDKSSYCYVDRKIGLNKRETYDPCVQALLIEDYANSNSMIKSGERIGDRISGVFNTNPTRVTAICRQTVQKIILRNEGIAPHIPRVKETPGTLYVMADEKFIPKQRRKEGEATKIMTKAAVIFEDIDQDILQNGKLSKRKYLINRMITANCDDFFWDEPINVLYKRYDMDMVKNIYLMGDGAPWIKSGVNELKTSTIQVKFGIDKYHFSQAIEKIAANASLAKKLRNYCYHDAKEDYKKLVTIIKENAPERLETIEQNERYILNHWEAFQTSVREIIIGCPMEQAISHILHSSFASVPKAYVEKNFKVYLNNRIIHQNHYDLRNLIIENKYKKQRKFNSDYDFSIFDKKDYLVPRVPFFDKNVITKF